MSHRPIRSPILASALALVAGAAVLHAQEVERYSLSGGDVAIYNLAGELRIEPGTGANVVVELVRGGRDAGELRIETGGVDGGRALRVVYPSDRVVYPALSRGSRTSVRVGEDGTFYGDRSGWRGRQVRISGSGSGLEAYADLRVRVPEGQRIAVHLAVGDAFVGNVSGTIVVDAGSSRIEAAGTRGSLRLDTGSGHISVRDAEGEVEVDTGSGGIDVQGVRGGRLLVDTGSGRVRGADIAVDALDVDTGSGGIELERVHANDVRLDTGSGSVRLDLLSDVSSLEIDTGSGGVTLSVPASLNARLELDTGSGGIDVDLPLQLIKSERNYLLARSGSGTGSVRVDTGSGGIRVRSN